MTPISASLFHINQRVDIMLAPTPQAERHHSRVEEINDSYLILAMPVSKGVPIILMPETTFYGRVLVDTTLWRFTSRFLGKKLEPLPIWIAAIPYDLEKVQHREFVRMDTALPTEIRPEGAEPDSPPTGATTVDISGGGAKLITKVAYPPGSKLRVIIEMGEYRRLAVTGQVLRCDYDQDKKICALGLKFVDISERERDKIIKYIFKKQLERRQKGFEV